MPMLGLLLLMRMCDNIFLGIGVGKITVNHSFMAITIKSISVYCVFLGNNHTFKK